MNTPKTFYISNDIRWLDYKEHTVIGFANPLPVEGDLLESHMASGRVAVFEFEFVVPGEPTGSFRADMRDRGYKDALVKSHAILEGKKVVGAVVGAVFTKRVHSSEHFLKKPPAIACGVASLTQVKGLGANTVEIIDLDNNNRRYYASIAKIEAEGIHMDRGHGHQIFLPLDKWSSTNQSQRTLDLVT